MLKKLMDRYCQLLSVLMVIGLALMVVLVFTNVVMRYAFNSGITVSEELSRWLFVWVTFLGAIVAMHYHRVGLTLSHYDARGHLIVARHRHRLVRNNVCAGHGAAATLWRTPRSRAAHPRRPHRP